MEMTRATMRLARCSEQAGNVNVAPPPSTSQCANQAHHSSTRAPTLPAAGAVRRKTVLKGGAFLREVRNAFLE